MVNVIMWSIKSHSIQKKLTLFDLEWHFIFWIYRNQLIMSNEWEFYAIRDIRKKNEREDIIVIL